MVREIRGFFRFMALLTAFVMLTAGTTHALPLHALPPHHADLVQQSDTSPQGFQTLQPLIGFETLSGVQDSPLRSGSTVGRYQALSVQFLDGVTTEYHTLDRAVGLSAAIAGLEIPKWEAITKANRTAVITNTTELKYFAARKSLRPLEVRLAELNRQYDRVLGNPVRLFKIGRYIEPGGAIILPEMIDDLPELEERILTSLINSYYHTRAEITRVVDAGRTAEKTVSVALKTVRATRIVSAVAEAVSVAFVVLDMVMLAVTVVLEAKEYKEIVESYDVERIKPGSDRESIYAKNAFGLFMVHYPTLNHNYYSPYVNDDYHYALRGLAKKRNTFDRAAYNELSDPVIHKYHNDEHDGTLGRDPYYFLPKNYTNKDVFDRIFLIEQEVFKGLKGLSGGLRMPPNLNYVSDGAFEGSDLDSLDFTEGEKIAAIGKNAFRGTRLRTIDLSGHFGLTSVSDGCFADNPELSTLRLPGTIIGLGANVLANTHKLDTVGIGWNDETLLEDVEQNLLDGNKYSPVFAGKKLQIPPGSFEQYYRHSPGNFRYLGGDFLLAENRPLLTVVENGGVFI
ncbi:hypothetical protein Barb6XT_00849 [Bacteroidales bacterium Barb6XT]|nr:hypothetical protein Barb6XT_00849 [Bacteroidales bacterium Barb6XT]